MKTKGARLTTQISLPGRFVVFVPQGEGLGVSRRLDDDERTRLKDILKKLQIKEGGIIVRTAAEGASEEDIERDLVFLQRVWKSIEAKAKTAKAPELIYQEAELPLRVTRDLFTGDFEKAYVDNDQAFKRITGYLKKTSPHMVERVVRYKDTPTLMEAFGVEQEIKSTLSRRVDLPSGGYLIFDYAEAFTVIDVNTGRFVGGRGKNSGGRLEDTITKNNLEAVKEVVRQLRLRDIGGIIVIDFIDMANPKNRAAVEEALRTELERDRTKTYVVEISPLGLVEMTRQNVTDGPREIMTRKCPTCGGDGIVYSEASAAIDVERRHPGARGRLQVAGVPHRGRGADRERARRLRRAQADRARGADEAALLLRGQAEHALRPLRPPRRGQARRPRAEGAGGRGRRADDRARRGRPSRRARRRRQARRSRRRASAKRPSSSARRSRFASSACSTASPTRRSCARRRRRPSRSRPRPRPRSRPASRPRARPRAPTRRRRPMTARTTDDGGRGRRRGGGRAGRSRGRRSKSPRPTRTSEDAEETPATSRPRRPVRPRRRRRAAARAAGATARSLPARVPRRRTATRPTRSRTTRPRPTSAAAEETPPRPTAVRTSTPRTPRTGGRSVTIHVPSDEFGRDPEDVEDAAGRRGRTGRGRRGRRRRTGRRPRRRRRAAARAAAATARSRQARARPEPRRTAAEAAAERTRSPTTSPRRSRSARSAPSPPCCRASSTEPVAEPEPRAGEPEPEPRGRRGGDRRTATGATSRCRSGAMTSSRPDRSGVSLHFRSIRGPLCPRFPRL